MVPRLLEACAVVSCGSDARAVAEANEWTLQLARSPSCWAACLAALARDDLPTRSVELLLCLCLSLVRQNQLAHAPSPDSLYPLLRRLHDSSSRPTPIVRLASSLVTALSSIDPNHCAHLVYWAVGPVLSAAEAPLAIQLLQDIAFEVFHRPIQSRPLSSVLRDASQDVIAFIDSVSLPPSSSSPGHNKLTHTQLPSLPPLSPSRLLPSSIPLSIHPSTR